MESSDVPISANSVSLLVIANILPLFAAFGQDYTNYFLSRSIDWPDWVVFAVGPLGVVWILSATIRALGPSHLKNAIGKGSEDDSLIEKDLMSSTSDNVCELWNGHNVVRLAAGGQIEEFLQFSVGSQINFREGRVGKMDFFREVNEGSRRYPDLDENLKHGHPKPKLPPNLLLNLGSPGRRFRVMAAMIHAFLLQLGFLTLLVLLKFDRSLNVRFIRIPLYSFIAAITGTITLTLALILCASQLDRTTVRRYWVPKPGTKHSLLIWMQRGTAENNSDNSIGSYIITKDIKNEIIESHPNQSYNPNKHPPSTSFLSYVILFGVAVGYVVQVVGLASMRYPAQVALFGITIIMSLTRAFLRQAPHPLACIKCPRLFEMDRLALAHVLDGTALWDQKAVETRPIWSIIGGRTWRYCHERPDKKHRGQKSMNLLHIRAELYRSCRWSCPASEIISPLCEAIETVAERYLPPENKHFIWYLSADLGDNVEDVPFTITRGDPRSRKWSLDRDRILSALSLWLFYDQQTSQSSEHAEESLRLLGPSEINANLTKWKLGKLCYCTTARNNSFQTRKFRRNRIVGFNETLGLRLPSEDNGPARQSIRGGPESQQDTIDLEILYDENEKNCAPAVHSRVKPAQLYALHIFSGFLWALSKDMSGIAQRTDVEDIANDVILTGLCDREDALLSILPPLLSNKKLK